MSVGLPYPTREPIPGSFRIISAIAEQQTLNILFSFVDSANNPHLCANGDMSSLTPLQLRLRKVICPRIAGEKLPFMSEVVKVTWANQRCEAPFESAVWI